MDAINNFGISIINSLQTLSPGLDGIMGLFSFMGTVEFYLILIPFIYWVVDARLGFRVLLVLLSADFVSGAFKQLLHQPRPYWIGDVQALSTEGSYGIPSSHASDSLAVWGYLSISLRKNWFSVFSFLLVLMIGISRLYLGVHFPQDVLFGWLIGAMIIYLFRKWEQKVIDFLQQYSMGRQILIIFSASLGMLLIGNLVVLVIANSPDPQSWTSFSAEARTAAHYYTVSGALFGAATGYLLMLKHAPFKTEGTVVQKLGRYLIGIVGVVIVWMGLDILFSTIAADESTLSYLLRYVRYAATTFWAIYVAPLVFIRLKLAEK